MKPAILVLALAALSPLAAQPVAAPPVLNVEDRRIELTVPIVGDVWGATPKGAEPLRYQWFRGAVPLPAPEGIQKTLVLEPPFVAGVYTCRVSNSAGEVVSKKVRVALTKSILAEDIKITVKVP